MSDYRLPPASSDDTRSDAPRQISDGPEISRFHSIVIQMLVNEDPPPHFHAIYGEYEISVRIRDGRVTGDFPPRAQRLVLEWRALHERELMANWKRLRSGETAQSIAPLL